MNKLTEDFLRAFSPAQVSNLQTLAIEMEVYGLSVQDVLDLCQEYFDVLKTKAMPTELEQQATFDPGAVKQTWKIIPCPDCGSGISISPVNVSKCTAIGGDWRSSLVCNNPDCRWNELSTETVESWRKG